MDKSEYSIDIEAIMKEIKEKVEANGPYEEIPSFEDIPVPKYVGGITAYGLRKEMDKRVADVDIPPVYPIEDQNPLKKLYKKFITKVVRCATFPMSQRETNVNRLLKENLVYLAAIVEEQQNQIDDLQNNIQNLEKAVEKLKQ